MKKYKVEITETLKKIVEVEAESEKKARDIAESKYLNGEDGYILDEDVLAQVDFRVQPL